MKSGQTLTSLSAHINVHRTLTNQKMIDLIHSLSLHVAQNHSNLCMLTYDCFQNIEISTIWFTVLFHDER